MATTERDAWLAASLETFIHERTAATGEPIEKVREIAERQQADLLGGPDATGHHSWESRDSDATGRPDLGRPPPPTASRPDRSLDPQPRDRHGLAWTWVRTLHPGTGRGSPQQRGGPQHCPQRFRQQHHRPAPVPDSRLQRGGGHHGQGAGRACEHTAVSPRVTAARAGGASAWAAPSRGCVLTPLRPPPKSCLVPVRRLRVMRTSSIVVAMRVG